MREKLAHPLKILMFLLFASLIIVLHYSIKGKFIIMGIIFLDSVLSRMLGILMAVVISIIIYGVFYQQKKIVPLTYAFYGFLLLNSLIYLSALVFIPEEIIAYLLENKGDLFTNSSPLFVFYTNSFFLIMLYGSILSLCYSSRKYFYNK